MRIFDSHFHIIDHRYPLQPNHGFIPNEFLVENYQHAMRDQNVIGGVVVSGSFQDIDYSYVQPALNKLGPKFVATIQIHTDIQEETIAKLNALGVRGIRFNLVRGNHVSTNEIRDLADKVYAIAEWHCEFYVDSAHLHNLFSTLSKLPAVSIDHLGLSQTGFDDIIRLAELGIRIKASGFGRVNFDVSTALQIIHSINPSALMFGSDLPGTRARRVFSSQDIHLIENSFASSDVERILYKNALKFYRIEL